MADIGQLATQELRPTPAERDEPMPAAPRATTVANPRRTRLTRLAQETSASS